MDEILPVLLSTRSTEPCNTSSTPVFQSVEPRNAASMAVSASQNLEVLRTSTRSIPQAWNIMYVDNIIRLHKDTYRQRIVPGTLELDNVNVIFLGTRNTDTHKKKQKNNSCEWDLGLRLTSDLQAECDHILY